MLLKHCKPPPHKLEANETADEISDSHFIFADACAIVRVTANENWECVKLFLVRYLFSGADGMQRVAANVN